jgi:phosphoesterase RecJ-like protein
LLLTHKKIDGDGLASTIALYLMLKKMHKNVTAICEDPVPDIYKFLPTTDILATALTNTKDFIVSIHCPDCEIDNLRYTMEEDRINIIISPKKGELTSKNISFKKGVNKYDLIIVLDTPDHESLGAIYDTHVDMFFSIPVINIDHHITNTYFGKINLVDVTASSTAEILLSFGQMITKENIMDEDIATLLLAGIIVDTGSFQNPNTTPVSFAAASKLIALGARQQEIIKNIYKTKKLTTLKLWGKILSNVKNDPIYRIVWSSVTYQELQQNNASKNDIAGIVDDLLANAPGAEIILLFVETDHNMVNVFIKTINPGIDASKIASLFAGTGSYSDGLCSLAAPLYEAEKQVLDKLCALQGNRLGITLHDQHEIPTPKREESFSTFLPQSQPIPEIPVTHLEDSLGASLLTQLKQEKGRTIQKKKE